MDNIVESNQRLRLKAEEFRKNRNKTVDWAFFGAGSCADRAIDAGFNPKIIIDNDEKKWGKYYNEKYKICGLQDFIRDYGKSLPIMITSTYAPEIGWQLKECGLEEYYSFLHITREHYGSWNLDREEREQAEKVRELFADQESKDLFSSIIEKREAYITDYHDLYKENQYFQDDILNIDEEEVFVDCGAFDGDTIEKFIGFTKGKYKKAFGFEMDYDNFKRLKDKFKEEEKIEPLNFGVWSEDTTLKYDVRSGGTGNIIVEQGEADVKCIALDHIITLSPTFIKMDIEGAELEALEGAKKLIQTYRPKLAVCVYHKADDMIKIPLWINHLVPEYKLYMRHHAADYEETVVYAVL